MKGVFMYNFYRRSDVIENFITIRFIYYSLLSIQKSSQKHDRCRDK